MKVGQKIKCMNDQIHPQIKSLYYQNFPKQFEVYTVREIRPDNAEGGILLEEIRNKPVFLAHYQGFVEPAFSKERFRLCGEEGFEEDRVELAIKRHRIIQSN